MWWPSATLPVACLSALSFINDSTLAKVGWADVVEPQHATSSTIVVVRIMAKLLESSQQCLEISKTVRLRVCCVYLRSPPFGAVCIKTLHKHLLSEISPLFQLSTIDPPNSCEACVTSSDVIQRFH